MPALTPRTHKSSPTQTHAEVEKPLMQRPSGSTAPQPPSSSTLKGDAGLFPHIKCKGKG